jgi:hypothetical protein
MVNELANTSLGAVAGLVIGCGLGWVVSARRPRQTDKALPAVEIDPVTNHRIDQAAEQWAAARGMPDASDLVARKLRLGFALQRRRQGQTQ